MIRNICMPMVRQTDYDYEMNYASMTSQAPCKPAYRHNSTFFVCPSLWSTSADRCLLHVWAFLWAMSVQKEEHIHVYLLLVRIDEGVMAHCTIPPPSPSILPLLQTNPFIIHHSFHTSLCKRGIYVRVTELSKHWKPNGVKWICIMREL